jgi:NAD(P)-dependent dehydrogenase (short-subunit alcohol dehydrogenase family)
MRRLGGVVMDVNGIAAIVTGGASGLGEAAATMLAQAGAKVAIFDLDVAAGERHAAKINGRFFEVDVTDDASVAAAIAAAEAAHGAARVLVNCAGIAIGVMTVGADGEPHPLDAFRRVIEINLIGTFNVIAKFSARLARQDPVGEERGVIINTASISAYDGMTSQAAYAASKGGVVGMTLPIARDLAPLGIRVVTTAPGAFWTPMVAGLTEELKASVASQVPFPSRFGKPEEFALLVASIIANPMLNGEVIRLDGAVRLAPH